MNLNLIIAWLVFITILIFILRADLHKGDNSNLKSTFKLKGNSVSSIRDSIGNVVIEYFPETKISSIEEKLISANSSLNVKAFMGIQFSLAILSLIVGANLSVFNIPFVIFIIISILLFFAPMVVLNEKVKKRKHEIEKDLPNMVGLLATAVQAGVELGPSLEAISVSMPGELGNELRLAWMEMATGKQLSQALNDMAKRTRVQILQNFVETIITAQERGGMNLSQVLSEFATTVIESQGRKANEAARKIPTKMLLPLFLCIFTPMLILLLTPVVLTILKTI